MPQISILVVDDEKEIADLVEIYLVSDGYRVFKAANAQPKTAWRSWRRRRSIWCFLTS